MSPQPTGPWRRPMRASALRGQPAFPACRSPLRGGAESAGLGQLFKWSSSTFLLRPQVGSALSLPIFDGGARRAQVDYSFAQYEE